VIVKEAISKYGTEILDHLDREVTVPVVTTAACQGDVSILRVTKNAATKPVPTAGFPVVRGENGGNTHSLHGDGPIFFDPAPARAGSLVLGRLTVPAESEAVMAHPEHGFLAIAPGTYEIGRQREFAGEWRMVAD
jgi:hypothetical protein